MKKISTLFLSTALFVGANAQITMNSNDIGDIGDTYIQRTDTNKNIYAVGAAGTNQTWNFSFQNWGEDTTELTNKNWTPYAAQFPGANLAGFNPNDPSGSDYFYINKSTADLRLMGGAVDVFGNGSKEILKWNPGRVLLKFPTAYGNTYSTPLYRAIKITVDTNISGPPPIDSIRYVSWETHFDTVDAWGSITLPSGTFASLRIQTISYRWDSIFVHSPLLPGTWTLITDAMDTTYTKTWWSNDPAAKFNLVEMRYDPLTGMNTDDITYLHAKYVNSVSELDKNYQANAYPVPANSELTISHPDIDAGTILVYNASGQKVAEQRINSELSKVNVVNYSNGFYFYQIQTPTGQFVTKGKFQVVK